MSPDHNLAAVRFVTWVIQVGCCVIVANYLSVAAATGGRLGDRLRMRVALGVAISAAGWVIQQAQWWVWQLAALANNAEVKASLERTYWPSLLGYFLVFGGTVLMVSPWLERVSGQLWPWVGILCVGILWVVGLLIAYRVEMA